MGDIERGDISIADISGTQRLPIQIGIIFSNDILKLIQMLSLRLNKICMVFW